VGAANFRVEQSDGAFHIIPVSIRGFSGKEILNRAPLNIAITLPIKVRTAWQELEELCATVSKLTHTRVIVGTIPTGMFSKSLGNAVQYRSQQGMPLRTCSIKRETESNSRGVCYMILA